MIRALILVLALSGCASQPTQEPDQPRTQKADYTEPTCGAVAAYSLISAVSLPAYLIAAGFVNRACREVAK